MTQPIKSGLEVQCLHYIALFCLFIFTISIYWPGLDSRFLLDDFSNLRELDTVKDYGYRFFAFSTGIAGPSGRPISLATFAFQHASWPDSAFDFKLVNLIIHLINGLLIYLISIFISKLVINNKFRTYLPIIATSLWLLHPIQLTTTLYVVQRMTSLSAFFILLGVLTYLCMRFRHLYKQSIYNDFFIGMMLLGITSLAILCKENGVLLLIYIWCLELTVLSQLKKPWYFSRWIILFLLFPIMLLIIYMSVKFNVNLNGYAFRDYGIVEKSLTEIAVLASYLKQIVIPNPSSFGLYHDDYQIVKNYFSVNYIVSALLVIGLLVSAIKYRVTKPIFSFSVLWFFSGHLLESTYLNLELYFEHRNYLPIYGIVFGIACVFVNLFQAAKYITWSIFCMFTYYALVIGITVLEIDLWSKPTLQIVEWARNQPNSSRAKNDLYYLYLNHNDDRAITINEEIKALNPGSLYPYIEELKFNSCHKENAITEKQWQVFYTIARKSRPTNLSAITALDNLTLSILKSECSTINTDDFKQLLNVLIKNNKYDAFNKSYFYEYLSSIEIFDGNIIKGLEYLKLSNSILPKLDKQLREILLLKKMGEYAIAMKKRDELLYSIKQNQSRWVYKKATKHFEQILN